MSIPFDDDAAETMARVARDGSTELRGQSVTRRNRADAASEDFEGGYARLFFSACATEVLDRIRLAIVFDSVAAQIEEAKEAAAKERERLSDMAAWEERQAERQRHPGVPGWTELSSALLDPKPSDVPVAPPTISAAFSVQVRDRFTSTESVSGTTSADPVALTSFVTESRAANDVLQTHLMGARRAWTTFTGSCSWVPLGTVTFLTGFSQFLAENRADTNWIEGIAQAFEAAGTGTLPNFDLSLVVATRNPSYLRVLLDHEDLTVEQIAVAVAYLEDHPELAGWVGAFVAGEVRGLNHDSSGEEIARAAALLNGFSSHGPASAAILRHLGAEDLIQSISLAGSLAYGGHEESIDLATGLRAVFRTGEPVMAANDPTASRQFAAALVGYLRGDRMGSSQPGNDPYALSYLLRDSRLSTPFLGEIGNELDVFERSFPSGQTWGQMGSMSHGGAWFFDETDIEAAFDPMASYMSALGLNGEAALQFFTGTGAELSGDHLSPAEAWDRQDYWIQRRIWGHDNFDGLLSALDAAVTTPENIALDRETTAGLASTSFEMLANRTQGEDADGNTIGFWSDDDKILPGSLGAEASVSLAHIFGAYMESVDYAIGAEPEWTGAGAVSMTREDLGTLTGMPAFNEDDLEVLLTAGLSREEGFVAFREAVTNYQDAHIGRVIAQHYDPSDVDGFRAVFDVATNSDAHLEAFFMSNLGEVAVAAGVERDEQLTAWIDLGSDLAGQIPVDKIPVAGPLVGFLADQGLSAGTDALTESLATHEADAIEGANEAARASFHGRQYAITGALYDGGVVTRAEVDALAEEMLIDPALVEDWFGDGFPDAETIRADNHLLSLVHGVGLGQIDMNEYRQNYQNNFREYFE